MLENCISTTLGSLKMYKILEVVLTVAILVLLVTSALIVYESKSPVVHFIGGFIGIVIAAGLLWENFVYPVYEYIKERSSRSKTSNSID